MRSSLLVKILKFPATLIHGDTAVLDRWGWLKRHLPRTKDGEKFLDAGCGSVAFTIYAAIRGYRSLGLSWDKENQQIASERAKLCSTSAEFKILDLRALHKATELTNQYDVIISFENIEHILDDYKLMVDLATCLKPGGRLLLTAPNYYSIHKNYEGPFSKIEDGGHVRRGYSPAMLQNLCRKAGLDCEEISYCTGALSQLILKLDISLRKIHPLFAWITILPLRILPPLFDKVITQFINWPYLSICMVAYKPYKN